MPHYVNGNWPIKMLNRGLGGGGEGKDRVVIIRRTVVGKSRCL